MHHHTDETFAYLFLLALFFIDIIECLMSLDTCNGHEELGKSFIKDLWFRIGKTRSQSACNISFAIFLVQFATQFES